MFKVDQHVNSLVRLSPWLGCSPSNFAIDDFLCRHCCHHFMSEIISFYGKNIVDHPCMKKGKLFSAMKKLSPDQRCVIILKLVMGFSNQEVADILSKSIAAVKVIQNRALTVLFHLLFPELELLAE